MERPAQLLSLVSKKPYANGVVTTFRCMQLLD